ncbi:MAG: lipoyl(octanoyl) transferase LipB [Nitrososphaerota archaeon]|jgi:lipoyl(octanoyl) transferase|nr:lipoyl(octanoyl) transferase LipB [Nitrososphaerota archaeon]MCL4356239.1 lipoyl(octanoyl) transferase LipB [Nitrososphaerota archaeon]MDG6903370.1 lipoyl(octanoyl) transferase LipB [Nitrososphaerota archaeon]MDG6911768.1 lipoyl(octanoyl) transferase LipB [Nitrososphaerota archaeon]MDG6940750.1 lipoyl(octanoyl) transferase LipB [Nitrososphaerota archaeon]
MSCFLFDLGTVEYGKALKFQKALAVRRAKGEIPDSLILVEHPHVVTLGRKTTPDNFKPQSIPVFQVERGGDATYHGPGQLVGYPIFLLNDHDVRRHVRSIEEAIIRSAAAYGIEGRLLEGHPGVWVSGKKLASIGVAVADWVSYHGFALNVNTDLSYFELIRPCGLDPSTMTSMQKMLGRRLPFEEVKARFVMEYSAATGLEFSSQRLPQSP